MMLKIKKMLFPYKLRVKQIIQKRQIKAYLAEKRDIYIELGAGNKKGSNGWLTIDMTSNCDIFWDLRNGIPFPDETVSGIYSSHFFEHLSYQEGQILLDDCMRVLRSGGTFSICVPNARLYLDAYLHSELKHDPFFGYKPAFNHTTKIDYVNYVAYMDGHHKYMFDEENLLHILKAKGMKKVRLRDFDPQVDLKERDFESIYAIGEKQ